MVVRKMEAHCPRAVYNHRFVNHHRNGKQKTQRNLAHAQTTSRRPYYCVCVDKGQDCHDLRVVCVQPKCKYPHTKEICTLVGLFVHAPPSGVIRHRERPRSKETIARTRHTFALSRGGVHVGVINTQLLQYIITSDSLASGCEECHLERALAGARSRGCRAGRVCGRIVRDTKPIMHLRSLLAGKWPGWPETPSVGEEALGVLHLELLERVARRRTRPPARGACRRGRARRGSGAWAARARRA